MYGAALIALNWQYPGARAARLAKPCDPQNPADELHKAGPAAAFFVRLSQLGSLQGLTHNLRTQNNSSTKSLDTLINRFICMNFLPNNVEVMSNAETAKNKY